MHKPVKEMHPPVFIATHWINAVSMLILILTGLYIHFPAFPGFMGIARGVHVFFGIIIFLNCIARIVLAFFVDDATTMGTRKKERDIRNWLPQKENRHQFFPMLRWYLFLKKDYPISAKYATMQKLAYIMIAIMIVCISYTGFCLWGVTNQWAIFAVGNSLVSNLFGFGGGGSLMPMRVIHYSLMWLLIIISLIHIYIATMHGFVAWRMIFLYKEDPDALHDDHAPAEA
ncbi:MAG: cytochrome b/b6 domain-containing protein [Actinomycetia bacterium]|nr:cytochrome b/b6 domain-containing protein [Actinomycetes bacterium]